MNSKNQLQQTVDVLKSTYSSIDKIITDPNIRFLKSKLLGAIQRETNALAMQIGVSAITTEEQTGTVHKPLQTFFGKPITSGVKGSYARSEKQEAVKTLTADEIAAAELKAAAAIIYPQFTSIESETIVDTYSDLEIRAVAKMADLPVTETNPKVINVEYVDKIKEAIVQKNLPEGGNGGISEIHFVGISDFPDNEVSVGIKTDEEIKIQELRQTAQKLFEVIPAMEPKDVIESYADLEIRAVAKMAGITVTEDSPKTITAAFINSIKKAIAKNAQPIPGLPAEHQ